MTINKLDDRAIFEFARKIDEGEARRAYVTEICGDDRAMTQRIEALLRAHDESDSFLERPPLGTSILPTIGQAGPERVGIQIGPYKLLEQIGEGGMGVVYVAEQSKPIRRRVALKIIKPGMDSRQVIARFEAERQTLAIMDHPNIAKVLDAGTTEAGLPYFVMELVKGTPITEFCDAQKLATRERLKLFTALCQAIQHAHQKGIIHRDIKPSNVLVEVHDVVPVPKVIDFGVAKAMGQQLSDKTLYTGFAQMIGTPLYMSPEQAGQSSIDIDTRSDVYSLGMLLYELLTGSTPFESETLRKAGQDEMRRIILEVDPPRPSARISTLVANALSTVSDRRQVEPKKLSKQLQGELDWIVMKALEKDRNRRYESANAMAQDIQRYLDDETVLACPPSLWYRMIKTGRRNRALIGTAAIVVLSLVIGLAGTAWQAVTATQESNRAVAAENQATINAERATAAEKEAQTQNAKSQRNLEAALVAIEKLLTHVGNPDLAEIPQLQDAFEKILDDSLAFYDQFAQEHGTSPGLQYRAVAVLERLAELAKETMKHPKAVEAYAKAIMLVDRLIEQSPDRVEHRAQQAEIYRLSGRFYMKRTVAPNAHEISLRQLHHAESLYRNLSLSEPGNKHYQAMEGDAMRAQAMLYKRMDATNPRIATMVTRAYEVTERSIPDWGAVKSMADELASSDPERADNLYRRALVIQRAIQNPTRANRNEHAWLCTEVAICFEPRRPMEAEECWQEAIHLLTALRREFPLLTRTHHVLFGAMSNYTRFLVKNNRVGDAQQLNHDLAAKFPEDHKVHAARSGFLVTLGNSEETILALTTAIEEFPGQSAYYRYRGSIQFQLSKYGNALADLKQAVALKYDDLSSLTWIPLVELAACPDAAFRKNFLQLADDVVKLNGNSSDSRATRAKILYAFGQQEKALAEFKGIVESERVSANIYNDFAWYLATARDPSRRDAVEALELAKRANELAPTDSRVLNTLGVCLFRLKDDTSAIETLQKSMGARQGGDSFDWFFLAMAHWQLEHKEEARKWYDKAVEWMDKNQPKNEELVRFRGETRELLGIDDKPK